MSTATTTKLVCPQCGSSEFEKRGEQRTYHPLADDLSDDSWTTGEIEMDTDNNGQDVIYCNSCDSELTEDEIRGACVTVELEAYAPEELALPTESLKWWITTPPGHCPLVRIEGARGLVEQFVLLHWGSDFMGEPFNSGVFFRDYAVEVPA